MAAEPKPIGIVPIGDVSGTTIKVLAGHISGYLNPNVDILPAMEPPSYAHDKRRFQYDAGIILKAMESRSPSGCMKILGVVDVDIFVPIFTHVFGESRQGGRCALVSIYRLKQDADGSSAPKDRVLERAAKVALHELGHLFELRHCMDARCLMHFSGEIENVDHTPLYFCRYCSIFLRGKLSKVKGIQTP